MPACSSACAVSARTRRDLFISSANGGTNNTVPRGSRAAGRRNTTNTGPRRPSKKLADRLPITSVHLGRDETAQGSQRLEDLGGDIVVVYGDAELLLDHADHRHDGHRIEFRKLAKQAAFVLERIGAVSELQRVAQNVAD